MLQTGNEVLTILIVSLCPMEYSTFGKHIIVDLWGVDFSLLDDIHFLEYHLVNAQIALVPMF